MTNTDRLIIQIWQKSALLSSANFKSLLAGLLDVKSIPDADELIAKLNIPQSEKKAVIDIIHLLQEFTITNKHSHADLLRLLQQLKDEYEVISKKLIINSTEQATPTLDRTPIFWKKNTPYLQLNKPQQEFLSILFKLYSNKKISSFKLAKDFYSMLISPQKTLFSQYFKKYVNYGRFENELLKNAEKEKELEKIHLLFEHQDEHKPYTYTDYITHIYNHLSQSAQRQFQNQKWYMFVWSLVTFLKKHEDLYKNNLIIRQLFHEFGLNDAEFKELYDALLTSGQLNNVQKNDLEKIYQHYLTANKKIAEESDSDIEDVEQLSSSQKRKKSKQKESGKEIFSIKPEYDVRIKLACADHIPKSSTFNYPKYSQHIVISDANNKSYKLLSNKITILPRDGLSEENAYQEGLDIKQYIIKMCKLNVNSAKNILVQPVVQDATWQEINRYKLMHNNIAVEFDCTIAPQTKAGTVVVRGQTILKLVTQYYELPPEAKKDKTSSSKSDSTTKKAKTSAATPPNMNSPPALIPAAASPQAPSSKSVENEQPSIPGVALSAKTPAAPACILNTSASLFRTKTAGDTTPTPYQTLSRIIPMTTTPTTRSTLIPIPPNPDHAKSSTPAAPPPTPSTPHQNPSEDIIDISDDETKELKTKLEEARILLATKQQQLHAEKAITEKQQFALLTAKKRKERELLDKLNADLETTQKAIAGEQQKQVKIQRRSEELLQELSSTPSPSLK